MTTLTITNPPHERVSASVDWHEVSLNKSFSGLCLWSPPNLCSDLVVACARCLTLAEGSKKESSVADLPACEIHQNQPDRQARIHTPTLGT